MSIAKKHTSAQGKPDARGRFGDYGGMFVPETLMQPLQELSDCYSQAKADPEFHRQVGYYLSQYVARPTPLYFAENLTRHAGGAKIYLKREDLCHTGSHKLNNTIPQLLLTLRMGKGRVIAETGAGQHGVATATAAALFGVECDVYMGEEDMRRQSLNVFRMELLGTRVIPVSSGTKTLKDAINEAMRDWVATVEGTHYVIGSVVGPHPFPVMVRDFQSVIGREAKQQFREVEERMPEYCIACVGGGSNSLGLFYPFLEEETKLIGVEGGGESLGPGRHAATLCVGTKGVLHGAYSYVLQDEHGQISTTHSISAGLDYPGVGPEHSFLKDSQRVEYVSVSDSEALAAFRLLSQIEGIIPALESAHAVAHGLQVAASASQGTAMIICLSGRGDKDLGIFAGGESP